MRRFVQAVTPLRGSCGVAVSGFEEKGDADDQQHVYCWTRPHACVSVPERRRHGSGGLQRPGSSDFPGDDSLVITPTSFLRSRPRGGFLDFPLLRHHRADPWLGRPGGSIPPRPRRKPSRRDLRPAHIHGPMQIAGTDGTPRPRNTRKEKTVYAPIARISKAIARYSIRQPRWIDEASEHVAHVNEANAVIRIR